MRNIGAFYQANMQTTKSTDVGYKSVTFIGEKAEYPSVFFMLGSDPFWTNTDLNFDFIPASMIKSNPHFASLSASNSYN